MAASSFVVVRRTISQTIVPYKDVEDRLLLKKSKEKSSSLGFSSTNNVARCGVTNSQDTKKTQKGLERSRSEVCLRRKNSYIRETSLDVFEERREEGLVKPVVRRREIKRINKARPQSDFFPEFSVGKKSKLLVHDKEKVNDSQNAAEKRLGRCIATLKREMMSLRRQDQELLKQLTSLNGHIQDLKEIARVQGGLYGANVEPGEVKEQSPVTTPCDKSSSPNEKNSPKKRREKNVGNAQGDFAQKEGKNEQGVCKRIKSDIKGLQETSFEYIEVSCDVSTPKTCRPKATAKRSQSTTIADVSRRKISSLRLERKSLSCQFLDSVRRDEFIKGKKNVIAESHETLASAEPRKTLPSSQIYTDQLKDVNDSNSKQKSLSLSQLRSITKTTEGSASDSECSTSGCYGGSSTGSDVELERGYFNMKTPNEARESMDKLFELNSLNLKPVGKRYLALDAQKQFRKKIVSV